MDEIELTELTDLDVVRQDAVRTPASGFPFLVMKAVNAVGGIDEKPDIAGAERVLQELARLIQSEAAEMAAGAFSEVYDIQCLLEAATLMRHFKSNEEWGCEDDGELCKSAGLVFKAHRKFSSDERKKLASEGNALEDGSYPIPDEDALRRAAILARSGHGDVAAAKRLIAKRAKELGVANPLASDAQKDAPEGVEDPTSAAPEPQEETVTKAAVSEIVKEAVAEAIKAAGERTEALAAELAVLKATPIPGQVSMTAPPAAAEARAQSDAMSKAAHFQRLADTVADREVAEYYRTRAQELREAARA